MNDEATPDQPLRRDREARARFVRYVISGVWNTAFGYGVFALLIAAFSSRVHYLALAAASYVIAISNAYVVHKFLVFQTRGNYLQEYLRYHAVYAGASFGGLALLAGLTSGLGVNVYLAQAGVLGLQALLGFAGHQRFSFIPPRSTA